MRGNCFRSDLFSRGAFAWQHWHEYQWDWKWQIIIYGALIQGGETARICRTWENLISKLSVQYLNKVFNKWRQVGVANIVAQRVFPQAVGVRLFWLVAKQFGRVSKSDGKTFAWPQGQERFQTWCISWCSYNIKAIFLPLLWNHHWWLLTTPWAPPCSQTGSWEITSGPNGGDEFDIKTKAPCWLHRDFYPGKGLLSSYWFVAIDRWIHCGPAVGLDRTALLLYLLSIFDLHWNLRKESYREPDYLLHKEKGNRRLETSRSQGLTRNKLVYKDMVWFMCKRTLVLQGALGSQIWHGHLAMVTRKYFQSSSALKWFYISETFACILFNRFSLSLGLVPSN